jgi:hypothetical protein
MRIAFHRTGESHDRIYVTRDDGGELGWRWPAGGPPHDLMHYAIETTLGLHDGFWGLTAAGTDLGELTPEQARSIDEAEAIVNAATSAVAVAGYGRTEARPPEVEPERFEAACDAAGEWIERWRALAAGETLVVFWPPGD